MEIDTVEMEMDRIVWMVAVLRLTFCIYEFYMHRGEVWAAGRGSPLVSS